MVDHMKPLTSKQKAALGRRACRSAGAAIVSAMAKSDTGIELIAKRRGYTVAKVRTKLLGFIEGRNGSLSDLSDFLFCCGGAVPEFGLEPVEEVTRLKAEVKALKHDIERYVKITSEQAAEIVALARAEAAPTDAGDR